jgi:hypothetical protein
MPFYMVKNSPEKVSKGVKSMESKFKLPCNVIHNTLFVM